jgi:hypothetical protein
MQRERHCSVLLTVAIGSARARIMHDLRESGDLVTSHHGAGQISDQALNQVEHHHREILPAVAAWRAALPSVQLVRERGFTLSTEAPWVLRFA